MVLKRKSPIWPYLGILACLFALSLAAPRSWERIARRPTANKLLSERTSSATEPTPNLERTLDIEPDLAQPSEKAPVDEDTSSIPRVTHPADRLAMVPLPHRSSVPPQQAERGEAAAGQPPREWSMPTALLVELDGLATNTPTYAWATGTTSQLHRLTSGPAADIGPILQDLRSLIQQAAELAPALDPPDQRRLRRARQALVRRLDVWEVVHKIRQQGHSVLIPGADNLALLAQHLTQVGTLIGTSEAGQGWRNYLLLDGLEALAQHGTPADPDERRALARRVLDRLHGPRLTHHQHRFISQAPIATLDAPLRRWAAEPVNIAQLLANLEQYEQTGLAEHAKRLAHDCRKLAWAAEPNLQELGRRLEHHYLAANMHVTVSGELINRLMPKPEKIRQPIYDTILNADVEGDSLTTTELSVRLLPDGGRLRFGLEARGRVASETFAYSGPATFYSEGRTTFLARKMIHVTPRGVLVWPAISNANGQSNLLGVDTYYDGIPLIGSLVRSIAEAQHESSQDEAMWEVENKVASEARRRLDTEANQRIAQFEDKFNRRLFGPLEKLALKPTPVSLVTTRKHLVARVRLAGDQQLSTSTSHPLAPVDSHLSVQIHLSAVNNAIEQLRLDGRQFTFPELYDLIADKLDRPDLTAPDDVPENVTVWLADTEAVRVSGIDGRIQVTLVIDEIKVRRSKFSNLKVRAFYRPNVSGLRAELVRDGNIQIESKKRLKAKAQIVLRGVFAKIFRRNQPLPLLGEPFVQNPRFDDFEVTQFEIEDDWLALAIGRKAKRDKVANRPE